MNQRNDKPGTRTSADQTRDIKKPGNPTSQIAETASGRAGPRQQTQGDAGSPLDHRRTQRPDLPSFNPQGSSADLGPDPKPPRSSKR